MDLNWPDLAALDLLVAISERGSLSAAAKSVGMAQPNASRMLSRWETHLGVHLIERRPHGSVLTSQGQAVAEWARPVLDAARAFATSLPSLTSREKSGLSIAASMTIAENLVPRWLTTLQSQNAGIKISLTVRNSEEVFDLVHSREVDLGFIETPHTRPGFHSHPIGTDQLIVVVASTHPWAHRTEPVTATELASTPLIVREHGSGTRLTLDQAFGGIAVAPPLLELGSNSAVRASVLAGDAPAVLSRLAVGPWISSGALCEVPLTGMNLRRSLRAIWIETPTPQGPARQLIRLIESDSRLGTNPRSIAPKYP